MNVYPRKRLRTRPYGGGNFRCTQRSEHLLHRSSIGRKHDPETCNNKSCRLRTTFRFLLPRIAKVRQETIATSLSIFVRFHQRRIITYGGCRNHQFRFGFDSIQGTDNTVCHCDPAIEKFLLMLRCPTLINGSACQIDNDIAMRQRLNQKSGHTFPKHRPSQRNDPVSTLFGQIAREMFAYISGGSGHCYIHLDSSFFQLY